MVKVDNISDVMHDETISSNETLATKINLDSDIKIIHTELTPETKTIETECANDVPINESKIASDNTSLNEFGTSSPENETKVKRKSIKSNEKQEDIDKARENTEYQIIKTNNTATEPTSTDITDHNEVTQKEGTNNIVINADNVKSKNNDIFEMLVADICLDVTQDKIKSSLENAKNKSNLNSNIENFDVELASGIKTIDSEYANEVPTNESGNTGLSELSASSPENEPKMKRKKRKSIKSKEEHIDIDKARENNITATEPTSIEMTDHKKLTKNERSKETVNNAKNVNSENNDMFEMAEADNSLDAPYDEMKSAIDSAITETNSNSIVENFNTEMAPEIRTINTDCVNDDPIIDADISMDKALSELSVSSLENETKKKRKKRKSIKSNEEQIIIEKAIENNIDQTNTSATEPTSVEVIGKTELTKKEDTNNEAMKANDVNENNHKTIGMIEANTSLDTPVEKNPSLETMKKETRPISNVKIETELAPEMIIVDKENASDVKNINSEAVSAFSAEKDTMKKEKEEKH